MKTALAASLLLLAASITAVLASLAKWLGLHTKNRRVRDLEQRLADSVVTVVTSIEQTFCQRWRAAKPHNNEDREALKAAAMQGVKDYWGADDLKNLKRVLGYADDAAFALSVGHDIEAAVLELHLGKRRNPPAEAPAEESPSPVAPACTGGNSWTFRL